ncbi:MAG TPA: hypothetical protein VGT44_22725 [Ktedonobacteraceae bacterium]|nr:hypothetical protein [Ktedonobacteraceae bacterium]
MEITAAEHYDTIAHDLAFKDGDVALGKMFGMPCIKVNGKAFAGFHRDEMVFKLTGSAHAQALGLDGARLFDPGMGHPMKEWVQVPFTNAEQWGTLAERALEYVGKRGV